MSDLKTGKDVLSFIEKENIEIVDLRFMDFPGLWQHFSIPGHELSEASFENLGNIHPCTVPLVLISGSVKLLKA